MPAGGQVHRSSPATGVSRILVAVVAYFSALGNHYLQA